VLAFVVRRLLSVVAVMVAVAALVFSVFYAFRPERIADGSGYPHSSCTSSIAPSCTWTSAPRGSAS
jgi:hypothetical protein